MSAFARRCGRDGSERRRDGDALVARLAAEDIHTVRIAWCDLHGGLRSKCVPAGMVRAALDDGIGLVATLLLKDSADRTALPVFDPAVAARLPVGAQAGNIRLLPDPNSLQPLPWAPGQAWLRADPYTEAGEPVPLDTRGLLQRQLARLAEAGFALRCGLEVEFHVYRRIDAAAHAAPMPADDPAASAWPPPAPAVALTHPGYRLLDDGLADRASPVLERVRAVAEGLRLPLRSLEIELGPSQYEAVFEPCDALTCADRMVAFRHGVRHALARDGYVASFACRPLPTAVASGWHLHQSLVPHGAAVTVPPVPSRSPIAGPDPAGEILGDAGAAWLAGMLAHAGGLAAFVAPTVGAYVRFQGGPMSPLRAVWGLDSRGAMLRVIRGDGPGQGHLENRLGEPGANPHLAIAAQVAAGLDGLRRGRRAPPPCDDPYGDGAGDPGSTDRLPASLDAALDAAAADPLWGDAFGGPFMSVFEAVKRADLARFAAAADRDEWLVRESLDRG